MLNTAVAEAKKMIDLSAKAGVDAVKFQTYRAETIVSKDAFFTFEDGSRENQYEFFTGF